MFKIGIFNIFFKRLCEGSLEELEFIVIENPCYYVPWNGGMKNTFYFILTNWICYCQISFCTYYAFSLNQMFDIQEVWKYWPLKDGFRLFSKKFYRSFRNFRNFTFCVGWTKKLLVDISFESGFQNIVLSSLLLFSCACYVSVFFILSQNVFSRFSKNTFF